MKTSTAHIKIAADDRNGTRKRVVFECNGYQVIKRTDKWGEARYLVKGRNPQYHGKVKDGGYISKGSAVKLAKQLGGAI